MGNYTMPDDSVFVVPKGCYSGLFHHNVSCRSPPPSPPPPHGIPGVIEKFFCAVANLNLIENKVTGAICNAINAKVGKNVPDCSEVLEFFWDKLVAKCPKGEALLV